MHGNINPPAIATLIAEYGIFMAPLGWKYAAILRSARPSPPQWNGLAGMGLGQFAVR
ncbi:MAG: hypothetical protein ACLPV8_27645 [Steroidobacteraceae bacterium]